MKVTQYFVSGELVTESQYRAWEATFAPPEHAVRGVLVATLIGDTVEIRDGDKAVLVLTRKQALWLVSRVAEALIRGA